MKAKEYYELYKLDLMSEKDDKVLKAISDLVHEFNKEVTELREIRHVKFDRGMIPILKEMNQKWNAIVRLFQKEYGATPIKPDGFKTFWLDQMPELKGKI